MMDIGNILITSTFGRGAYFGLLGNIFVFFNIYGRTTNEKNDNKGNKISHLKTPYDNYRSIYNYFKALI
jgi:hypothetical protein